VVGEKEGLTQRRERRIGTRTSVVREKERLTQMREEEDTEDVTAWESMVGSTPGGVMAEAGKWSYDRWTLMRADGTEDHGEMGARC
jgi:hypothetical protein